MSKQAGSVNDYFKAQRSWPGEAGENRCRECDKDFSGNLNRSFCRECDPAESAPAAEPPDAVQGPLLSTIHSQPSTSIEIATARPPAAANPDPKDRGDIIGWTSYTANNGQCLVVVDFVSDPLLFKASKGVRGWMSVRTAPSTLDDQEKARQVSSLQNYIFAKVVCNLDVLTGGKESA